MNRIEKGKAGLLWFGVALGIFAVGLLVGSVLSVVFGVKAPTNGWLIALGIVLFVLAIILGIVAITFIWTASAIVATKGSIKEDNLAKGTANMIKCDKCGNEIDAETNKCVKCGKPYSGK